MQDSTDRTDPRDLNSVAVRLVLDYKLYADSQNIYVVKECFLPFSVPLMHLKKKNVHSADRMHKHPSMNHRQENILISLIKLW